MGKVVVFFLQRMGNVEVFSEDGKGIYLSRRLGYRTTISLWLYSPTLTKGSNWQITQIWESDVFTLNLAYSKSIPSLEQKHSSCWKIFKSRYNDIALMSMYMTNTFCSVTRNFILKSCFLLSVYGSIFLYKPHNLSQHWMLIVLASIVFHHEQFENFDNQFWFLF